MSRRRERKAAARALDDLYMSIIERQFADECGVLDADADAHAVTWCTETGQQMDEIDRILGGTA